MNIEPVWHSVNPMQIATRSALENHEPRKIVAKLKNGKIVFYTDAESDNDVVEVFFLP